MLIPKDSGQLMSNDTEANMDIDTKGTPDSSQDRPDSQQPENIVSVKQANINYPENNMVNGSVNGDVKPHSSVKCMNILQNIIIKNEDEGRIQIPSQIPIKREIDEDALNSRIKMPRRETAANVAPIIPNSPIKEEVLEINEVQDSNNSISVQCLSDSEPNTEVHTCFRCNMIFMEKDAYAIHLTHCQKNDNYTAQPQEVQNCNNSGNNRPDDSNYILHIDREPQQLQQQSSVHLLHPLPTASNRALDLFFKSMCESAKCLPFNLQLQVKKKIFDSIFEAEEIFNRLNHMRNESFSPPHSSGDDHFQY